jgi:hypothetical protein
MRICCLCGKPVICDYGYVTNPDGSVEHVWLGHCS